MEISITIDEYDDQTSTSSPSNTNTTNRNAQRRRNGILIPIFLGALVMTICVVTWYGVSKSRQQPPSSSIEQSPGSGMSNINNIEAQGGDISITINEATTQPTEEENLEQVVIDEETSPPTSQSPTSPHLLSNMPSSSEKTPSPTTKSTITTSLESSSPSDAPSQSPMMGLPSLGCNDTPNWFDIYGDGCEWYELNDSPGCPDHGYYDGGMGLPVDNCCHCQVAVTSTPTKAPVIGPETSSDPTVSPSNSPVTSNPTTTAPSVLIPAHTAIVNTFTVLEQVQHDPTSFTQGLSYDTDKNIILETTGLYGQSKVRRINPKTYEVETSINLPSQYFGEGSTFYNDKDGNRRLIMITWREQTGFIYNADTLEQLYAFQYTTTPQFGNEGWGITYDETNQEFIVSDGSSYLYFWDRDTLEEKRKVEVTRLDGQKTQANLNELEFIGGRVCCNIWYSDHIICVDPATGKSVREYDMSSLRPSGERGVLNGIALGKDHVLITGKKWDRMYRVIFPDWPSLFDDSK